MASMLIEINDRLNRGWIRAAVGCYWYRGRDTISTISTSQAGTCYQLTRDRRVIAQGPTFEAVEQYAEPCAP